MIGASYGCVSVIQGPASVPVTPAWMMRIVHLLGTNLKLVWPALPQPQQR
jgi:hypothetical protein